MQMYKSYITPGHLAINGLFKKIFGMLISIVGLSLNYLPLGNNIFTFITCATFYQTSIASIKKRLPKESRHKKIGCQTHMHGQPELF